MQRAMILTYLVAMSFAFAEQTSKPFNVGVKIIGDDGSEKHSSLQFSKDGDCVGSNGTKKITHKKSICENLPLKFSKALEDAPQGLTGFHQKKFGINVTYNGKSWSAEIPAYAHATCDAAGKNCTKPEVLPAREMAVEILKINSANQ